MTSPYLDHIRSTRETIEALIVAREAALAKAGAAAQRWRVERDLSFLRDEPTRVDGARTERAASCNSKARREMSALDSELAALSKLSAHELRMKWQALRCGEPMAPASRDLLIREIAYKLQERALGGLAQAIKRRLRAMAEEMQQNGAGALAPALLLKPGTRLLREWGGRTHTVVVLDDGFEYDGNRYRSLTQIARRITGAHWSGPRFFGLRKATAQTMDASGAKG